MHYQENRANAGEGQDLPTSSFSQKSQSLQRQMEAMTDKLFETDRLLQMQALLRLQIQKDVSKASQISSNNSTKVVSQKNEPVYVATTGQQTYTKMSPSQIAAQKPTSPFRYSSATMRRKMNSNPTTSRIKEWHIKDSDLNGDQDAYKTNGLGGVVNVLQESGNSSQFTQLAHESQKITKNSTHCDILDQLNQSQNMHKNIQMYGNVFERRELGSKPSKADVLRMQKFQGNDEKFETEQELTDRSSKPMTLSKNKHDDIKTPASKFQIIPETSMEMSDSIKNSNSNFDESGVIRDMSTQIRNREQLLKDLELYQSKEKPNLVFRDNLQETTQNRRNNQNMDKIDSKGITQHLDYRDNHLHRPVTTSEEEYKSNYNNKGTAQFQIKANEGCRSAVNKSNYENMIHQIMWNETGELPIDVQHLGLSSSQFNKSEPMQSDAETQGQTVKSGVINQMNKNIKKESLIPPRHTGQNKQFEQSQTMAIQSNDNENKRNQSIENSPLLLNLQRVGVDTQQKSQNSAQNIRNLKMAAPQRNAASHQFLHTNEQALGPQFRITKSPSFLTSQEQYISLEEPRSKRNQSLEEQLLQNSQEIGFSPPKANKSMVICKNQMSNQSKSNHQRIMDNIIAQNRHQSQQSMRVGKITEHSNSANRNKHVSRSVNNASNLSRRLNERDILENSSEIRVAGGDIGASKKNFRNHMSSIQNFEHIQDPQLMPSQPIMVQNQKLLHLAYPSFELENFNLPQYTSQVPTALSTNQWAHLMPQGNIPDQIHPNNFRLGEGGVVTVGQVDSLTSNHQREQIYLFEDENSTSQYVNSLNSKHPPTKNLRNAFFQGALTFNGNNQSSNGRHDKNEQRNDANQTMSHVSQFDDQRDVSVEEQKVINILNQNSFFQGTEFPYNSMGYQMDQKHFKTHQHNQQTWDKPQMASYIHQEGTTSGFFSNGEMAGLKVALQDYNSRRPASMLESNLQQQSMSSTPGQIRQTERSYLDCQVLVNQALSADSIFDLPTAINELNKAIRSIKLLSTRLQEFQIQDQEHQLQYKCLNDQNEQLQQEILQVESDKLQIEQELLEVVEQRDELTEQNEVLRENISYQMTLNADLQRQIDEHNQKQEQLNFMQKVLTDRTHETKELEQQNNMLLKRDLEIQNTVAKLKHRYKQKLLDKQKELEDIRLQFSEFQQQFEIKMEEMNQLAILNQENHFNQKNLKSSPYNHNSKEQKSFLSSEVKQLESFGYHQSSKQNIREDQQEMANNYQQLKNINQSDRSHHLSEALTKFNSKQNTQQMHQLNNVGGHADMSVYQMIEKDNQSQNSLSHSLSEQPVKSPVSNSKIVYNQYALELEKLKSFITDTIQTLVVKNHPESEQRRSLLNNSNLEDPTLQGIARAVQGLENLVGDENHQLKLQQTLNEQKVKILQAQNDQLSNDNNTMRQTIHKQKNEILNLQANKVEQAALMREQDKVKKLKSRNDSLEEQILALVQNKENVQFANAFLQDIKLLMGFVLSKLDFKHKEVPKQLSIFMKNGTDLQIQTQEIKNLLEKVDDRLQVLLVSQQKAKKLNSLKEENKELLKILHLEQNNRRQLQNRLQEVKGNIRVLCRIRPMILAERKQSLQQVKIHHIGSNKIQIESQNNQLKTFQFDRVLKSNSSQEEIQIEVKNLISSSLEGYNVCIFAYGQTGSGKTYTMVGDDQNPGLYFSSVSEIFSVIKQNKDRIDYNLSVSVIEIYNEQIRDLLSKDQENSSKLRLLEGGDGNLYGDQVKRKVTSKNQILKALRDACYNRTIGVTELNEYSSRSHFIMTLFITGYDKVTKNVFKGKLSLVDLAGSERILKTEADEQRIKEAQSINQSLATLGKVILHLQNKTPHVPYRDSKLTHYLRDSIGGNAKTLMIVQISPLMKDLPESISSLSFGQRAQRIEKGNITATVGISRSRSKHNRSASQKSKFSEAKSKKSIKSAKSVRSKKRSASSLIRKPLREISHKQLVASSSVFDSRPLSHSMMKLPKGASKQKRNLMMDESMIKRKKRSLSKSAMEPQFKNEAFELKRHTTKHSNRIKLIDQTGGESNRDILPHPYENAFNDDSEFNLVSANEERPDLSLRTQSHNSMAPSHQFYKLPQMAYNTEAAMKIVNIHARNENCYISNEQHKAGGANRASPYTQQNQVSYSSILDSKSPGGSHHLHSQSNTYESNIADASAYKMGAYPGIVQPSDMLEHKKKHTPQLVRQILYQTDFNNIASARSQDKVNESNSEAQHYVSLRANHSNGKQLPSTQLPTVAQTPTSRSQLQRPGVTPKEFTLQKV